MAQMNGLRPCPFCGSGAVLLVEPRVLSRCVWIECSDCHVTSPVFEYQGSSDIDETCKQMGEAYRKVKAFWNKRAGDDVSIQPD